MRTIGCIRMASTLRSPPNLGPILYVLVMHLGIDDMEGLMAVLHLRMVIAAGRIVIDSEDDRLC
jgi:hypothetical protein